ncbi:hypothetical protein M9435_003592 [Picochlorum sp. BPE23]|nr:hypothetical protein M9435_003592 [Picochlorum sp. BPE23]
MDPYMDDTGFVSAAVEDDAHGDASATEAFQFSFFGDLSAVKDEELGGALEDGLDAPPEEETLVDGIEAEEEDVTADLSYTSMFANVLGKGDGVFEGDETFETETDPLAEMMAEEETKVDTSSAFASGSIALGGLLAASAPSHEEGFGASYEQQGGFGTRGVLQAPFPGPPQPPGQAPLPPHSGIQTGGVKGPLTAQELEAQLRGGGPPTQGYGYSSGPPPPPQGMGGMFPPPVSGGPPMQPPSQRQMGVFTTDMIMQQQQQMPPPVQQMPPPQPPVQQMPPPPPPPPMQQPGAWQQPRPMQHAEMMHQPQFVTQGTAPGVQDHNTLAQRLRALNLAEKTSPTKKPVFNGQKRSSRFMFRDEIDSILFMQSKALHMAPPYLEDYYYQAFVSKYYDGKNSDVFAPESVRELAPTEKVAAENVAFVKLEGLGRVAFSNIRRPRPLMDVSIESVNKATEDREDTSKPHAKRLEQEPALAARIMIEDCMALILDVEDVDRIFIASKGENLENKDALKQRRTLLVEGLASSLRLSEHPQGKVDSDSVFLKLLSRNKGITLAIRAMKITFPPEEMNRDSSTKVTPNYRILWALLRRLGTIYRSELLQNSQNPVQAKEMVESLSSLATAMMDVLSSIKSPHALGDAMVALSHAGISDSISFFSPGETASDTDRKPWACDIIATLLARGAELALHNTVSDDSHGNSWSEGIEHLYKFFESNLQSKEKILSSSDTSEEERSSIRKSIPVPMIGQYCMPQFTEKQKTVIQNLLLKCDV